jgi:hypothetical protein
MPWQSRVVEIQPTFHPPTHPFRKKPPRHDTLFTRRKPFSMTRFFSEAGQTNDEGFFFVGSKKEK